MNRADRLYSVLKDGGSYSRLEIFERVGFMLTNNAASELRARGFDVRHSLERGNDVYRIVLAEAAGRVPPSAASASTPPLTQPPPEPHPHGRDGTGVLTLFEAAA